ncbi:RHS repeat-associated core domain-containing protein [Streptomyces sp. NPDC059009]|uniref:RHS repeat-associated core domain-containing protein n=1 Tax=Streptomyces sp. NPDC059009 TaxID=3346694 RepID=UPI0036BCB922
MSHRPADWHILDLDKDPTPGDPQRVRKLAKNLHDFADDVSDVLRDIKGMAGDDAILTWAGKTADSFTAEFEDAPGKLKKLKKSYEMAGDALADYWPKLERAQALADKALAKGREAQGDLSSAKSKLSSADSWVDRAGKEADKYKDKDGGGSGGKDVPKPDEDKVKAATRNAHAAEKAQSDAKTDVSNAQSALDAAKKMAEDARKMREDAAGTAKKKIDEASDAGIHNRKWWEEVGDWVSDNWDTIVAVCKVVVAVLGIVAMIIGGPILGAIVLVAALVVLADTLNKYANGQASLWDVGFAALDCIPGMKGLTSLRGLAKGIKGFSKVGLKGMAMGVKGMGKRMQGLGRKMQDLFTCGDPIDMATGQMVMSIADLSLPGVLPLVLERSHRTGVRAGRRFGSDWVSTLDQRLLIGDDGLRFVAADGTVLYYAVPEAGEPQGPIVGPNWPLHWDGSPSGEMEIQQPEDGTTLRFAPVPGARTAELSLVEVADRNGNTIGIRYASDGSPMELVHHGGYRIGVTTDGEQVTALTLLSAPEQPLLVTYEYDEQGRLTGVVDSSGVPQSYRYDDRQRITGWQSRHGDWYQYAYDDVDRCVRTGGTGSMDGVLAYTYAYDEDAGTTVATDSLGHALTYRFDEAYRPLSETDPLGHTFTREWDDRGRLTALIDPLGRTTHFRHDGAGNVIEVVRPDEGVITREYNDQYQVTKVTQPDGSSWESTYDERGNRIAVVDPLGARTSFTVDQHGALTSITDALGQVQQRISNDAAGLVVATQGPLGDGTSLVRDAFGRITQLADPFGQITRVGWTVEGQLAWRELPNGTSEHWSYDAEGNPLEYRSSDGRRTSYENTHFDLCAVRTSEDGTHEEFTYDTELRLRHVTNAAGQQWSYEYDSVGRILAETDFNGRTLTYRYDAAGQLVERVNGAGQVTAFRYDALGNIVTMDADGVVTHYAHDVLGRLVGARNAEVELGIEHDAAGRVLAERWNGHEVRSAYDPTGRRTTRRTPSGAVTDWTYDVADRSLTQHVGEHDVAFRYDIAGREIERLLGDAARLTHTWDGERLRATQRLSAADGAPLRERAYQHRTDGALTSITESGHGERSFALDQAGRITATHSGAGDETYEYDVLGNLTRYETSMPVREADETTGLGAAAELSYTGTLIDRAGRTFYRHDGQGRVVRRVTKLLSGGRQEWRYIWNAEDQLTDVRTPNGQHWHYVYDPLGRRVAKQLLDEDDARVLEQVSFFWDGDRLAEQTDGSTSTTWDWDDNGDFPVSQRVRRLTSAAGASQEEIDERFYAIVTDLIGTPTELLDTQGGIVWSRNSTLWGVPTRGPGSRVGSVDCLLRFPGQYYDAETGLHYNHHRYYEPGTARYLSPDPLGRTPSSNHYAYVKNPLQWKDPLGLKAPCMVDLYHGTFGKAADSIVGDGINLAASNRAMDFGKGGFYVTNDPKQALEWANRLAKQKNDVPAILHFRVPKSELDSLNGKIFNGPSDELASFIKHHRNEGAMHGYDLVEGPMLRNVRGFAFGNKPPVFSGHQVAIYSDRAADLFNRSFHRRHGPSS